MEYQNLTPLLREPQAATVLNVSPVTLAELRKSGRGPRHIRLGRKGVRYTPTALQDFISSREQPEKIGTTMEKNDRKR